MVSLSVVLLSAATSKTVVRWMVVWWMDVRWMDSDRLWSWTVLLQVLQSLPLVSLRVLMLTVFDMSSVDLLPLLNRQVLSGRSLEPTPVLHLKGSLHVTPHR